MEKILMRIVELIKDDPKLYESVLKFIEAKTLAESELAN